LNIYARIQGIEEILGILESGNISTVTKSNIAINLDGDSNACVNSKQHLQFQTMTYVKI
jgi:hypothetical protein